MEEVRKEGNKVVVEIDSRIYDHASVVEALKNFSCKAKLKKYPGSFLVTLDSKNENDGFEFYNFLLDKVKEKRVM